MYIIVIVSSLFTLGGEPAQVATGASYFSKDACTLMARKLTEGSNLKHVCVKAEQPKV